MAFRIDRGVFKFFDSDDSTFKKAFELDGDGNFILAQNSNMFAARNADGTQKETIIGNTRAATVNLAVYSGSLNITGSAKFSNNIEIEGLNPAIKLVDTNGADWDIDLQDNHLRFKVGSTEYLRFQNGGKVGIGTTSPSYKLDIYESGSTQPIRTREASSVYRAFEVNYNDTYTTQLKFGKFGELTYDGNGGRMYITNAGTNAVNNWIQFKMADTAAMHIAGNRNIGIGTTSPSYKLHVEGDSVYVTGGSSNSKWMRMYVNDSWAYLTTNSSKYYLNAELRVDGGRIGSYDENLQLRTGGTTRMTVLNSNGNTGIGTTSPSASLHVSGTNDVVKIEGSGSTILDIQGSQGQLFSVTDSLEGSLFSVNDISGLPILEAFDTDKVVMGTFGSNTLVVTGSKVGVGTDTPRQKLDVIGNIYAGSGTVDNLIRSYYSDGNYTEMRGYGLQFNRVSSYIRPTADKQKAMYFGTDGATWTQVSFDSSNYYFKEDATTHVSIVSGGNVGIGTSSPAFLLSLDGSTTNKIAFQNGSGIYSDKAYIEYVKSGDDTNLAFGTTSDTYDAIERMRITHDGKVGIGTTSPSVDFEVAGTAKFTGGSISIGNSNSGVIYYNNNTNTNIAMTSTLMKMKVDNITMLSLNEPSWGQDEVVVNEDSNNVDFRVEGNGDANLLFTNAGTDKVGIGTNSPDEKLHVQGNLKFEQASGDIDVRYTLNGTNKYNMFYQASTDGWGLYYNPGTAYRLFISGSGNVGIGTNTPSRKLSVEGNAYVKDRFYVDVDSPGTNLREDSQIRLQSRGNQAGTVRSSHWYLKTDSDSIYGNSAFIVTKNYDGGSQVEHFRISSAGDVTIKQDLTVEGIVTAQEFHTEFVSASITYSSGSTKFGDTSDDIHSFTGSLEVSGAVSSEGADGGMVMRYWNGGPNYGMIGTVGMSTDEYALLTNGTHTYLGAGSGGNLTLRSNANDTSAQLVINGGSNKAYFEGGNVGIGTTSPGSPLHVAGNIGVAPTGDGVHIGKYSSGGSVYGNIQLQGNKGGYIDFSTSGTDWKGRILYDASSDYMRLDTNGSEKVRIDSSGNVGIGTTSPAFKLDVQGGTRVQGADSTATINDYGIFAIENQQREGIGFGYDTDANTAWIYAREVGVTSRKLNVQGSVFIDNYGGNVGIGTNSPSNKLDVAGGAEFNGETYIRGTSNIGLRIQATDQGIGGSDGLRVGINGTHAFVWNYENTPLSFGTNGSQKATILANGNVGIGTTSPAQKLDVAGTLHATAIYVDEYIYHNADTNTALRFTDDDIQFNAGGLTMFKLTEGTTDEVIVNPDGANLNFRVEGDTDTNLIKTDASNDRVGIGQSTPIEKLHVDGNIHIEAESNSLGAAGLYFGISNSRNLAIRQTSTQKDFAIDTYNGTESWVNRLTIRNAGGNVGIGTAAPSHKLHVSGTYDVVKIEGSGSANSSSLFEVHGNNGLLFAIDDDLSDSLFSVNTIAGLPVIEAFSDNRVVMGAFNQNDFVISGSRVGIGTDTPVAPLQVIGDVQLNNASNLSGKIVYHSNAYYTTGGPYHGDIRHIAPRHRFYHESVSGSALLNLDSGTSYFSGTNVGIGTTSPGALLDIGSGATARGSYTDLLIGPNGNNAQLEFYGANTSFAISHYNNDRLGIFPNVGGNWNEANGISIKASSGNVGIGTTNPQATLHVNGSVRFEDLTSGILKVDSDGDLSVDTNTYLTSFDITTQTDGKYLRSNANDSFSGILTGTAAGENLKVGGIRGTAKGSQTGQYIHLYERVHIGGPNGWGNSAHGAPSAGLSTWGSVDFGMNGSGVIQLDGTTIVNASRQLINVTNTNWDTAYEWGDHSTEGYLTSYTETQTLDDVTDLGATTTNNISVGTLTASGGGNTVVLKKGTGTPALAFAGTSDEASALLEGISGGGLTLYTSNGGTLSTPAWSAKMTVRANGNVGIGTTNPKAPLHVAGNISGSADIQIEGSLGVGVRPNATDGRIDASNDIVAYSTSDRRLKENITPIENALDKVYEIQGVEFDWKPLQEEEVKTVHGNIGHDIGVIAQEIESVLPEAVTTRENGYKAVRYEKIVPLLIQAVKEQQDQINELKEIINGLTR